MRVQTSRQAAVAAFALLLAAGAVSRGLAQTTYGSIVGTARDASGAVVPQVTVTVTNQATSTNETAVTNELGAYAFTTLFPGKYRIHGELTGFRPLDITGIQLQVNQVARFDLIMQVGQVSEKVEVVATLATLATETSDVGGPASALGSGVDSALTGGAEPESGDEGRASTQPQPAGD